MSPEVIFLGAGTFLVCLAAHVILWRLRRPHRHALALLAVFFMGGASLLSLERVIFHLGIENWIAVALLHFAMSCGYIQLYPASQAQSPSVTILLAVKKSMPRGMSEAEIVSLINPGKIFHDRIEDLTASGLVTGQNGTLALTARGRAFIRPFMIYRALLGIPEGKG